MGWDRLPTRLFAVIDTWDTLLSDRPYRLAWSVDETRDYMIAQSGKSFEMEVIGTFLSAICLRACWAGRMHIRYFRFNRTVRLIL